MSRGIRSAASSLYLSHSLLCFFHRRWFRNITTTSMAAAAEADFLEKQSPETRHLSDGCSSLNPQVAAAPFIRSLRGC